MNGMDKSVGILVYRVHQVHQGKRYTFLGNKNFFNHDEHDERDG
jgi:hypothetical protein